MQPFLYRLVLYKGKGVGSVETKRNENANMQQLYDDCKLMMNYHVIIRMKDGQVNDSFLNHRR